VETLSPFQVFLAGAGGGFAYWLFTYPIDSIKSSMIADNPIKSKRIYPTIITTARKMWAEGGMARFFHGFTPCLLRAAPANAVCFVAYEWTIGMMKTK